MSADDDVSVLQQQIARLEFEIFDQCCTCGAGGNDKEEHADWCLAISLIEPNHERHNDEQR